MSIVRRLSPWALALAFASGVAAQTLPSTGNIFGTVVDVQGAPLSGVEATLRGPLAGERPPVETDARGTFRFLYLSPGIYDVTLSRSGFATVDYREVAVAVDRSTTLRVAMKPAAAPESVTMTGALPSIDARKTVTGATFGKEELQEIPNARDIWAVLWEVPNVVDDQVDVAGNSVLQAVPVSKGVSGALYNYDGADITLAGISPMYYNYDAFQAIQVVTGGSDAGLLSSAATFNLVTRRGSNGIHGSGRYFYAPNRWQDDNTPAEVDLSGLEANRTNVLRDYGVEAGASLVPDRLWLWGAWGDDDIDLDKVGQVDTAGRPVREDTTLVNFDARLDAQLAASNSLGLFYHHGQRTQAGRGVGVNVAPESGRDLDQPTPLYKISDTQVFSPSLTASAFFSYLDFRQDALPVGGVDTPMYVDGDGVLRGSNYIFQAHAIQRQIGASASKFFGTGGLSHELKFGFGYKSTVFDSLSAAPGDRVWGDEQQGLAFVTRAAATGSKAYQIGGFVSDTISADRLTVNLGLRYDYGKARNTASAVGANPSYPDVLPGIEYAGDDGYPIAAGAWQPRVGATYAVGKERHTLLRASYARFADLALNQVFVSNAFPGTQGVYYYWEDTNGNHIVDPGEFDPGSPVGAYGVDPSNPGSLTSPNRISPDFVATKVDEVVVGFDQELVCGLTASLQYTWRSIHGLPFTPFVGVTGGGGGYAYSGQARGTATDPFGFQVAFDVPYFGLTLDPPPFGVELQNRPAYRQTYNGVGLSVVRPFADRWLVRGTFSWNSWKQSVSPEAVFDPNDLASGLNTQGVPGGPNRDGGKVTGVPATFSAWTFSLSGLYRLPLGFAVAGNFVGRQGFPLEYFVRIRTTDTQGDTVNVLTDPVGTYRLDDVYELDLRLENTFAVGPVSITPSIDVLNVANASTVLRRRTRVGTYSERNDSFSQDAQFNLIREYQSPRIVRAGIRAAF